MKEALKNLWANHKKKIIVAGIIVVVAIIVYACGAASAVGCN